MRWCLLLLVACGTHHAPPQVANLAPDAGVALAKGCPASYPPTGSCTTDQSCAYPEGSCYCGPAPVCSGMVRSPEWYQQQPVSWQCTPTPPAVRADGCPGTEPSGACSASDDGKQCTYGSCCVKQVVCQGGQWVLGMAACPP